jgi:hypothetical protein
VIIPTDADPKGHLYAFDTASGELLWKLPFEQGVAASPLLVDGRVVAVGETGDVVAVDPERGATVWLGQVAELLLRRACMRAPREAATIVSASTSAASRASVSTTSPSFFTTECGVATTPESLTATPMRRPP